MHRQNLASAKSLTDNSEPHQPASKYNAKKAEQEQEKQYEMDAVSVGGWGTLDACIMQSCMHAWGYSMRALLESS